MRVDSPVEPLPAAVDEPVAVVVVAAAEVGDEAVVPGEAILLRVNEPHFVWN